MPFSLSPVLLRELSNVSLVLTDGLSVLHKKYAPFHPRLIPFFLDITIKFSSCLLYHLTIDGKESTHLQEQCNILQQALLHRYADCFRADGNQLTWSRYQLLSVNLELANLRELSINSLKYARLVCNIYDKMMTFRLLGDHLNHMHMWSLRTLILLSQQSKHFHLTLIFAKDLCIWFEDHSIEGDLCLNFMTLFV